MRATKAETNNPFLGARENMQNLDDINFTEVLDRVLDHCIVVDPSARIYLMGVDLRDVEGRFVVESVQFF